MKLKVLVDNNTYIDQYYYGEPGVSYYIEDEDSKILFDVGYSDLFLKNIYKFNLNLKDINTIVISHGHDDHTGGLKYYFNEELKKDDISIIAHPNAFKEKVFDNIKICSPLLEDKLNEKCNLILSKKPIKISKNVIFLGEIPQLNDFENREVIGRQKNNNDYDLDYVFDDSALCYKNKNGIYIITGCSHSGICNIIEYAKKVCNNSRVLGVIGGFHLFEINHRVKKTIDYLKNNDIKELYPCHCTSLYVKAEMLKTLPINEVGVGLELEW